MYRVAVRTALLNTSLIPILIYDGSDVTFIKEIEDDGVTVVAHKFLNSSSPSFTSRTNYWKNIASGTYLRVDIPYICEQLYISDTYVLYTDVDILFLTDIVPELSTKTPEYFAVCPESYKDDLVNINGGVLLLNRRNMAATHRSFLAYIDNNYSDINYDQFAYQNFYFGKYESLDCAYNYKPYWGINNGAKIIHYHGPKPYDIQEYIEKNEVRKVFTNIYVMVDISVWKYYYKLYFDVCKLIPGFRFNQTIDDSFDWKTYIDNYDDLASSGIVTQASAISHWKYIGRDEGRTYKPLNPPLNWEAYLANYPDLAEAGIVTQDAALAHWKTYGKADGRTDIPMTTCASLDWKTYLMNYPDLGNSGITTEGAAKRHWVMNGQAEGRTDKLIVVKDPINWETYLEYNPDLVKAGLVTRSAAISHWIYKGQGEGRKVDLITDEEIESPVSEPFDWVTYQSNYPDLVAAGITTETATNAHWKNHGQIESRTYKAIVPLESQSESPTESQSESPTESQSESPNVIIYVLCYTEEKVQAATTNFAAYGWAKPILVKYHDATCENAFWKQLLEIKEEWGSCDMVGTIANAVINLEEIDAIISNRAMWASGYYNFNMYDAPIRADGHPNLLTIVKDVLGSLQMTAPPLSYYNYWICRPELMVQFITWSTDVLIPAVLAHPLSNSDSTFIDGTLSLSALCAKFGVPYYPHTPFVLEQLNAAFFLQDKGVIVQPKA